MSVRGDIFTEHSRKNFEEESGRFFKIESAIKIRDSGRIIHLMRKRN